MQDQDGQNNNIVEEHADNILGSTVWHGLASRGFEEAITVRTYLQMLKIMISRFNGVSENEIEVKVQQEGAPPLFHANVRSFLEHKFSQAWI